MDTKEFDKATEQKSWENAVFNLLISQQNQINMLFKIVEQQQVLNNQTADLIGEIIGKAMPPNTTK